MNHAELVENSEIDDLISLRDYAAREIMKRAVGVLQGLNEWNPQDTDIRDVYLGQDVVRIVIMDRAGAMSIREVPIKTWNLLSRSTSGS